MAQYPYPTDPRGTRMFPSRRLVHTARDGARFLMEVGSSVSDPAAERRDYAPRITATQDYIRIGDLEISRKVWVLLSEEWENSILVPPVHILQTGSGG